MLPNRTGEVIDLNEAGVVVASVGRPFFVGSDGGEQRYFVDAATADSPVYVYELETGHHRVLVASWAEYLEHIRDTHDEITADEAAARSRQLIKRWWEFWK
jgi:hypothetical protein